MTIEPTTIPAMIPPLWASKTESEVDAASVADADGVADNVEVEVEVEEGNEDVEVVLVLEDGGVIVGGAGELVANAPIPDRVKEGDGAAVPETSFAAATN